MLFLQQMYIPSTLVETGNGAFSYWGGDIPLKIKENSVYFVIYAKCIIFANVNIRMEAVC